MTQVIASRYSAPRGSYFPHIEGEGLPVVARVECDPRLRTGWVAALRGRDPKMRFNREFLAHERELNRSRSGWREREYLLGPGIYELSTVVKSLTPGRIYISVDAAGRVEVLSSDQAEARLAEAEQPEDPDPAPTGAGSADPAAAVETAAAEPAPRRRGRRARRRERISYDWWHSTLPPTPPQEGMGDWVRELEQLLRTQVAPTAWVQVKALAYREGQWEEIMSLEAPAAEWPGLRREICTILESEDGAILALGEHVLAGELADRSPVVAIATPGRAAEAEGVQS